MRRKLAALALGLTLVACERQSTTDAGSDAAPSDLVLSVRYTDEEISRDSNSEDVQITLDGAALTYERTRGGFGAEHSPDPHTTVELSADEVALIEQWIAEGG